MLRANSSQCSASCSGFWLVRRAAVLTTMALVMGCASAPKAAAPAETWESSLPTDGAPAFGSIDETESTPVVQVRDFPGLRTISVLGFYNENATYGLRAEVRPDGKLIAPRRRGDHRLYINSYVVRANGGFRRASVTSRDYPLVLGYLRDDNSCLQGPPCSPHTSLTLGIPDSVLRNSHDGLEVTFERQSPTQWSISFSPEMIAAYLFSVDSVIAARRTN